MDSKDRCPNTPNKLYEILLRTFFLFQEFVYFWKFKIKIFLKHTKSYSLNYIVFLRGVRALVLNIHGSFWPIWYKTLFFIQRKTENHTFWVKIIYFIYPFFFQKIFGCLIYRNTILWPEKKKFLRNIHDMNSAPLKCNIYFSENDNSSFISNELETAMDIED